LVTDAVKSSVSIRGRYDVPGPNTGRLHRAATVEFVVIDARALECAAPGQRSSAAESRAAERRVFMVASWFLSSQTRRSPST